MGNGEYSGEFRVTEAPIWSVVNEILGYKVGASLATKLQQMKVS